MPGGTDNDEKRTQMDAETTDLRRFLIRVHLPFPRHPRSIFASGDMPGGTDNDEKRTQMDAETTDLRRFLIRVHLPFPRHPRSIFASVRRISTGPVAPIVATGSAFVWYLFGAAPGLTWAHSGADGGDLLAAALSNGTPHPTGYPLYTLLLQGWLALLGLLLPASDIAWRGNIFSALAGALSVGVTFQVGRYLWRKNERPILPALLTASAWATAPMLWGQALITEVYALHSLLFAGLFWALVCFPSASLRGRALLLGGLFGLGLAHHATIGLLLPGMLYWLWSEENHRARRVDFWVWWAVGLLPGLLLYARIPLAAFFTPQSPVQWNGSGSLADFWWLVSGAAYRRYLFAVPLGGLLPKVGGWAQTLVSQMTPIGLALALAGLYHWDRLEARLRSLSLLWVGAASLYTIGYHTADSEVYLLPVIWLMALWLPFGVLELAGWLDTKGAGGTDNDEKRTQIDAETTDLRRFFIRVNHFFQRHQRPIYRAGMGSQTLLLTLCMLGVVGLAGLRYPSLSLRQDMAARQFLSGAVSALEPGSLVFSSADAETFALWYGAWGNGELLESAPGSVLVNVALLQFGWYRTQLSRLYPDLPGVETGDAAGILQANSGSRPIYFTEIVLPARADLLRPAGPIWRYLP